MPFTFGKQRDMNNIRHNMAFELVAPKAARPSTLRWRPLESVTFFKAELSYLGNH